MFVSIRSYNNVSGLDELATKLEAGFEYLLDSLQRFQPLEGGMASLCVGRRLCGRCGRLRFGSKAVFDAQIVGGVEGVGLVLWSFDQVELDKVWNIRKVDVPVEPDILETLFLTGFYTETVHCYGHKRSSCSRSPKVMIDGVSLTLLFACIVD